MEEIPITGLEELESHLQHLVHDPETPLNAKLFDEVELQLTGKQIQPSWDLCIIPWIHCLAMKLIESALQVGECRCWE